MSWSETVAQETMRSYDEHIHASLDAFRNDLRDFMQPLARELGPIHDAGEMHGGVHPGALRYSKGGSLDVSHFLAQRRPPGGHLDPGILHAFVAPEVLQGAEGSGASDCYAVGALLFYLVTGSPPAPAARRAQDRLALDPTVFSEWPALALSAINRALMLDPAARFPSIRTMWAAMFDPGPNGTRDATSGAELGGAKGDSDFPEHVEIAERLPNGSVGKVYDVSLLDWFEGASNRGKEFGVAVPEEVGLIFDSETKRLRGVPVRAGEYNVEYWMGAEGVRRLGLTINPDPAALWKEIASDPAGEYAKPDNRCESRDFGAIVALAASVRGRSHAHIGGYREDDFAMGSCLDWALFAVADGAGSAALSRHGSYVATRAMIGALEQRITTNGKEIQSALQGVGCGSDASAIETARCAAHNLLTSAAYRALCAVSEACGSRSIRDFSTTLLAVMARKLEAGGWFFAGFGVGDGGAAVVGDCWVQMLSVPDSGEFAGQTSFLTSPELFPNTALLLNRTRAAVCDSFQMMAMMTDGVADPLFASDAALGERAAWAKLEGTVLRRLEGAADREDGAAKLEAALKFFSPGNHDDRTLVLARPATV